MGDKRSASNIRMTPGLWRAIKAVAKVEGISVNTAMERAAENYVSSRTSAVLAYATSVSPITTGPGSGEALVQAVTTYKPRPIEDL